MFSSSLFTRRAALGTILAGAASTLLPRRSCAAPELSAQANVEKAHQQIWSRFVDNYDILLDAADLQGKYPRPTPEECREGKPNALGWWTATENGSMFNGMYMDGLVARWRVTKSADDARKAERLVRGLLKLSSLGPKGFMARNVATDGQTPYPLGSNDQSGPGLYGMWRFLEAGLGDTQLQGEVKARFLEIAEVLRGNKWRMPTMPYAPSKIRGTFEHIKWEDAPRLLFLLKAAHQLSGDREWDQLYQQHLHEANAAGETRLAVCAAGMKFHHPERRESWTGASSAIGLRALWEMEKDEALKAKFAEGLHKSAELAAGGLPLAKDYVNGNPTKVELDWRKLLPWWKPQTSEKEAVEVAELQNKQFGPMNPRRYQEFKLVREPSFAAWVVTLCPNAEYVRSQREGILGVVGHYDYTQLYYSQFFPVEAAYYRLATL